MEVKKGTHTEYKTSLFVPIMKEAKGKYIAVLSDDSIDRDNESLSKGCIRKLSEDDSYLAALCNHNNDVFMQVAEWTNKGYREVDGHTALIAEPKFFMSNPNAKIIKGMLDEGAKLGISIGAIVKEYDEINKKRVFTELELLEASFVAIPSNRHGRAMAVAKSFNKEEKTMEKEYTQKDIDSTVEKKVEEVKLELNKTIESQKAEIAKLQADIKKSEEDSEKAKEEAEAEKEEAEKKLEEANKQIEVEKNKAIEKMKITEEGGEDKPEDVDKAMKEGSLPFFRM